MYDFTKTVVLNTNVLPDGKAIWSGQEASGSKPANFNVKKVAKYIKPNVVSIYKAVGKNGDNAKVTFDMSQLSTTQNSIRRLYIYLGLTQASQESIYSNDLQYKGKPLSIEFEWTGSDISKIASNLVKTINKYELFVYGHKLLNVTSSGTFITFQAMDEFQRFIQIRFEKLDETAHFGMGHYDLERSLDDITTEVTESALVTGDSEKKFLGREGFGTYSYLLHNLRLPTYENTRPFSVALDEMPIPGALYNQYTIHYSVNRGILGDNAVGDTVTSKTTHVFYVKQDLATSFETALNCIGTPVEVGPGITSAADPITYSNEYLSKKADEYDTNIAKKQDKLIAGDAIEISAANQVTVKLDGASLTKSADGLKVTS